MATAYRTLIMLGTLTVGSMGWVVYGPPPEKLGPAIDDVAAWIKKTAGVDSPNPDALQPLSEAPLLAAVAPEVSMPAASAAPAADPFVSPASFAGIIPPAGEPIPAESASGLQPLALPPAPPAGNDLQALPEISPLIQQLQQFGAVECQLEPWGTEPGVFRCACRIPFAGQPGMNQEFDALENSPAGAVKRVLSQIESWRSGQLRPISP